MKKKNPKQNKSEDIMKNQKVLGESAVIQEQYKGSSKSPNTSQIKGGGIGKNMNTSGANQGGTVSKGPNTSQIK